MAASCLFFCVYYRGFRGNTASMLASSTREKCRSLLHNGKLDCTPTHTFYKGEACTQSRAPIWEITCPFIIDELVRTRLALRTRTRTVVNIALLASIK